MTFIYGPDEFLHDRVDYPCPPDVEPPLPPDGGDGFRSGFWWGVITGMLIAAFWVAVIWLCLLLSGKVHAAERPAGVDVAIILAADVSQSMRPDELEVQRAGYAAALRDPAIVAAIGNGRARRIALAMFEWASYGETYPVLGWTVIGSAEDALRAADTISNAGLNSGHSTSITGALTHARALFAALPLPSGRLVVDVSGDGINNDGGSIVLARDLLVGDGVTINGLPIVTDGEDSPVSYYDECVIGGPGAFVIPVYGLDAMAHALRAKLVMEIAGVDATAGIVPAGTTNCNGG